ncbi:MAG: hypothetical protein ACJASJ_001333, partial [Candidatus Azotimanducaceae bacterium]
MATTMLATTKVHSNEALVRLMMFLLDMMCSFIGRIGVAGAIFFVPAGLLA